MPCLSPHSRGGPAPADQPETFDHAPDWVDAIVNWMAEQDALAGYAFSRLDNAKLATFKLIPKHNFALSANLREFRFSHLTVEQCADTKAKLWQLVQNFFDRGLNAVTRRDRPKRRGWFPVWSSGDLKSASRSSLG